MKIIMNNNNNIKYTLLKETNAIIYLKMNKNYIFIYNLLFFKYKDILWLFNFLHIFNVFLKEISLFL